MSDLDLDIRAVASASYGARVSASDVSQVAAAVYDQSSLATNTQALSDSTATQAIAAASNQPTFRYDSFRFTYQSDYGKIVLVDQNPETGKAVSQIPSQRALQLYADQRRAELQATLSAGAAATAPRQTAAVATTTTGRRETAAPQPTVSTPTPTTTGSPGVRSVSTPTPAPAPSVSPTPSSTPPAAFIAAAATPVNITI